MFVGSQAIVITVIQGVVDVGLSVKDINLTSLKLSLDLQFVLGFIFRNQTKDNNQVFRLKILLTVVDSL